MARTCALLIMSAHTKTTLHSHACPFHICTVVGQSPEARDAMVHPARWRRRLPHHKCEDQQRPERKWPCKTQRSVRIPSGGGHSRASTSSMNAFFLFQFRQAHACARRVFFWCESNAKCVCMCCPYVHRGEDHPVGHARWCEHKIQDP